MSLRCGPARMYSTAPQGKGGRARCGVPALSMSSPYPPTPLGKSYPRPARAPRRIARGLLPCKHVCDPTSTHA
jgi:hypothetical protein